MKLVQFKKEHGHCNVPRKYEADPSLGTWVSKQRQNYRNFQERKPCKGMNKERIDKLNHLGFVWNALEATWLEYFVSFYHVHSCIRISWWILMADLHIILFHGTTR